MRQTQCHSTRLKVYIWPYLSFENQNCFMLVWKMTLVSVFVQFQRSSFYADYLFSWTTPILSPNLYLITMSFDKEMHFLFCFSKLWLSVLMISTNHLSFRSSLTILRMVHQISQSHFLSLHHGPRKFQRLASFQYSDRFVDNTKLLLLVGFQLEVAILRAGVKPANSDHLINLVK